MPVEISQMVDRYHYRLVRYLIYLTGRRDRVEDLVQETWVRVLGVRESIRRTVAI